jgi:alanine dehydrogenase
MPKKIKFLSQTDVMKCIDMLSAIEAMKIAFSELSKGNVNAPLRVNMNLENSDSGALFMPVNFPAKKLVGLKSVMIHKNNPSNNLPMIQAMYNVFNAETGEPIAIMDGEYLTSIRTGAASGLATDLLSIKEAKIAVIFGAGIQSEKQLEAICAVRDLENIYISDLNDSRIAKLIDTIQPKVNAKLEKLIDNKFLNDADIICTATSSSFPVFEHANIKETVHVNGIGSYKPDMCEIPSETIVNSKLYVDSREACLCEAGDIIQPINNNRITEEHIFAEIGEVVSEVKEGRKDTDRITVFKSVGNAVQDIAAAAVILENADKLKIGTEINL